MLTSLLRPRVDAAYALLRAVAGLLFAFHGVQKIFGVFSQVHPAVGSQLWVGGILEIVTGVALAVGALTTWMAFLASGTMAVAYIQFHWKLALGAQLIPAVNKGEPALLYCFLFLFMACHGGGTWSLDGWLERRRSGI